MEQEGRVDSELGAELAGMVSGGDGAEAGVAVPRGTRWQVNLP